MTSPTRKLAAAALAAVGVIHLVLSPEYLSEQTYIGVLFIAGGLFLCALAVPLWRADNVPSWLLGALTMAGMGIGFVLSRTTGLPGLPRVRVGALRASWRSCSRPASSPPRSRRCSRRARPRRRRRRRPALQPRAHRTGPRRAPPRGRRQRLSGLRA